MEAKASILYNCHVGVFLKRYAALLAILAFSTLQFFLILRHKDPFVSDTYFYKHVYYQLQGSSSEDARRKIISEIDLQNADMVTKNIFLNENAYNNSYSFFSKRPFYPFSIYLLSFFTNDYYAFLIPVFLSYLGLITLVYFLSRTALTEFFSIFTTALFISFYPFLDWSTYFLTDTISAFFWLMCVFWIYIFIKTNSPTILVLFAVTLAVSLLNREQNGLILAVIPILILLSFLLKLPINIIKRSVNLFLVTLIVVGIFFTTFTVLGQRSLTDTLNYIQNNHGLLSKTYTMQETFNYVTSSIILDHKIFLIDLVKHHWWFTFLVLSLLGIINFFRAKKTQSVEAALILASGITSYLLVFIFPHYSYKYYFPLLFTIVFFTSHFLQTYFKKY